MNLTKTPYLVLFIILVGVGVSVASASITITLAGTVDMDNNQIKNVQTPTEPQDAATKEYVDTTAILPPSTQTQIDNIETETDKIQMVSDDAHTVKYVKVLDRPTNDDAFPGFQISVECDKNFLVTSLIATVSDPDSTIDIRYVEAVLLGPGFGFNQVPTSWKIKHTDLDPSASSSQQGFELLSQMEIEIPIGVAANGIFSVLGDVTASTDESNDTIDIGAVVTTSQDAQCSVIIRP